MTRRNGTGLAEFTPATSCAPWLRILLSTKVNEMIPSLNTRSRLLGASAVALLALAFSGDAAAQTKVKPGFNVFSVQQASAASSR